MCQFVLSQMASKGSLDFRHRALVPFETYSRSESQRRSLI